MEAEMAYLLEEKTTEEIEGIASDTNSEATVECFLGCPKSNDLMKKYMRKHYRRTR